MAGAYCIYCDQRCFVLRTVPDGSHAGWSGHMATCPEGMAHDRRYLGGYDSSTSINPYARPAEDWEPPGAGWDENTPW